MKFIEKVEMVIVHPHKFFKKIEKEKSVKPTLQFYTVFVFATLLLYTLFVLPDMSQDVMSISAGQYVFFVLMVIAYLLVVTVLTVLASLALYWAFHALIRVFKGKENYTQTYKLLYASTPLLIVSPLVMISLLPTYSAFTLIAVPLFIVAAVDALYLEYVGLQQLQKLSKENAFVLLVLLVIIAGFSMKYMRGII